MAKLKRTEAHEISERFRLMLDFVEKLQYEFRERGLMNEAELLSNQLTATEVELRNCKNVFSKIAKARSNE